MIDHRDTVKSLHEMKHQTTSSKKSELKQAGHIFTALCANVEHAIVATKNSFQEMYLLHDELSKKKLPSSMLSKLTTLSCDLQQNMSNLLIGVERLVDKTRMYAKPLEDQCNAMMELREQNAIKQRQLEIALKKLEVMSGRNEQLEKKRIIGKWERLYLKCSNYKNVNLGWRNTVKEYQTKLRNDESIAYLFRNLDNDESVCDQNSEVYVSSDRPLNDENDFHFSSDPGDSQDEQSDSVEDELLFESNIAENSSILDWVSKVSTDARKSCDILTDELSPPAVQMSKSRLSVYSDDTSDEITEGSSFNITYNDGLENSEFVPTSNLPFLQSIVETPETTDVFTSTSELDSFFRVRIINPDWLNIDLPFYILTFNSQVVKTQSDAPNPYDEDVSLEYPETSNDNKTVEISKENIFCFDLECSSDDVFKSEGLRNSSLKIALQENSSAGILAFTSISSNELNVYSEEDFEESIETEKFINKLELYFPGKDLPKDLDPGNLYLSVICTIFQRKKATCKDESVGTLTYDKLEELIIDNFLDLRRERCQSACVETDEKPIYTEECFKALDDELNALKEASDSSVRCIKVDASTSPLLGNSNEMDFDPQLEYVHLYPRQAASCPIRRVRFDDANMAFLGKRLEREQTVPKMSSKSKRICEKLPEDFLDRLQLFQESKGKNRDQLKKDITEKNQEEICKRLGAAQKLCSAGSTPLLHESCLPNVFMPVKNNIVYRTKGRSYFHSSNQAVKMAQLKPMFSLPDVQDTLPNGNLRSIRLDAAEAVN